MSDISIEEALQSFPPQSFAHLDGQEMEEDALLECVHAEHYISAKMNFATWLRLEYAARNATGSPDDVTVLLRQAVPYRLGTVVFSAVALEAAINFYARSHDMRFVKDYENSLSIMTKWQMYPKLIGGDYLADHVLVHVKRISQLRDRVVHPKPKWVSTSDLSQFPLFGPPQGAHMLNIAADALAALLKDHAKSFCGEKLNNAHDWDKDCFLV